MGLLSPRGSQFTTTTVAGTGNAMTRRDPALLAYHIINHMGASVYKAEFCYILIRLSSQYYRESTALVTSVIRLSSQ